MKFGFSASPFLNNKILLAYAVGMTVVASSILLIPAQTTPPNVHYKLFKIGQTSPDAVLVGNGWNPIGYGCQSANSVQIAQGTGPTVCGYTYKTASHNLITAGGIDWLMCSMSRSKIQCSTTASQIALSTLTTTPAVNDCPTATETTCLLGGTSAVNGEITVFGLARAVGAFTPTNDTTGASTSTYTLVKTFTATNTINGVQLSGIFTKPCFTGTTCNTATNTNGVMVFENTFSSTNMINLDTLQVTWTITV